MSTAAAPVRSRSSHLYEVDVLRILTFACVVMVHTISFTAASNDVWLYGVEALIHFTRLVFFGLTAFVLVYSFLRKPRPLSVFWPKRYLLVGVPYLTWSLVYALSSWVTSDSQRGDVGALIERYATGIVGGSAKYHLYFLLVTMQVYLILPSLVWLVRVTTRHHVLLVVASFVFQGGVLALNKYDPSALSWTDGYTDTLFPTYAFFIVGGAVAAAHVDAILTFIRERRVLVWWTLAASGVLTLLVYAVQLGAGQSPSSAATALQPVEMVWSAAVGFAFLAIGAAWADRRRPDSFLARAVDYASDRSFGIFLSHPLVLWALLLGGVFAGIVPRPESTPVAYVLVVAGAVALTELLRRSPLSMPFTGRPAFRRERVSGRSSRGATDADAPAPR